MAEAKSETPRAKSLDERVTPEAFEQALQEIVVVDDDPEICMKRVMQIPQGHHLVSTTLQEVMDGFDHALLDANMPRAQRLAYLAGFTQALLVDRWAFELQLRAEASERSEQNADQPRS